MKNKLVGKTVSKAFTTKMICTNCKTSFVILKGGEMETGECDQCGCTSFHTKDGRPWGHKHRYWNDWVRSVWRLDDADHITDETLYCFPEIEEIHEYMAFA